MFFAEIWCCDTILRRDYAMTSPRDDVTTSFSNFKKKKKKFFFSIFSNKLTFIYQLKKYIYICFAEIWCCDNFAPWLRDDVTARWRHNVI